MQPNDLSNQSKIAVLDDHVANLIAAGEVVERPASVAKELVENAIDAGATSITVTLEDGGKELIKVTDNGCGMSREDAVMSLQRHATSKISQPDDLDRITTLGFRGEALPSVASVSILGMLTCREGDAYGTELSVEGGTITDLKAVGAPRGTTMSVGRLFYNTPARLKFLKTAQTELTHISEIVGQFAMAYPHVCFRLLHGSREVLSSAGTGVRLNSIAQVLGNDTARQLVPVNLVSADISVEGFVASPSLSRTARREQVFFVNGRPVRSRTIIHALDQAYRGLLQLGRYAVAVLFINVASDSVDVNVHPSKAEVKFSRENEVHSAVHRAVNLALMSGAAAPSISQTQGRSSQNITMRPDQPYLVQQTLPAHTEVDIKAFSEALAARRAEAIADINTDDPFVWRKGSGVPVEESPVPEADFEAMRTVALSGVSVIGQARNTYIIAQCDDGVLLIDQHVAHERVLYDQMVGSKMGTGFVVQGLLTPVSIALSARESMVVSQRMDQLRQAGFDLEPFGPNTFLMRAVPAGLSNDVAEQTLHDMVAELVDLSVARHLVVRADQVLITASCKMAVKAGDSMSIAEMTRLVDDLLKCDNPFVCPHGRPIIVSLSNWELDRKFRRA